MYVYDTKYVSQEVNEGKKMFINQSVFRTPVSRIFFISTDRSKDAKIIDKNKKKI